MMNQKTAQYRLFPVAPASFFAMTLGLAETGNMLRFAHDTWMIPRIVGEIFEFLAVLSFLWFGLLFINKWLHHRNAAINELRDPIQASFIALVPESLLLLALASSPYLSVLSHTLFWIASISNVLYAMYRFSNMWTVIRTSEQITPSLFLTYTASVLVNALVAGLLGYQTYGWMLFGVGTMAWLFLDSVVLQQLMTGGLATKSRNFMGIYMAPAAIVLVAYQVLSGDNSSPMVTYSLAGYAFFLTLSLGLSYRWLREQDFAPGYWAYTFGLATLAQGFLLMAREQHAPLFQAVTWVLVSISLMLTLTVGVHSVRLLLEKRYYPPAPHPALSQSCGKASMENVQR
ncbi:hypothetical protein HQN90_10335 [Paenibacillus alba]|uniref:SLAC1 family transporter n=1 Tax=Paenibacillus alba TaxID=1197127 RepID=UPI0015640F29|nr:hypothetical protein [Paenibacillus alba]NQX66523.1 hypothetical protein [Paenibacillus alba]